MFHNTRKKFRLRNTRKEFSSRRKTLFQMKEKKEERNKKK